MAAFRGLLMRHVFYLHQRQAHKSLSCSAVCH